VRAPAAFLLLLLASPSAPAQETAVVTAAVQDLFVRPDETSSVDDQLILGDRVTVLESAAGFAKVKTAAGEIAWIPERALRRGARANAPAKAQRLAHVTSNFAHVYATPSFERQKPLLTAPIGTTLEEEKENSSEGQEGNSAAGATTGDSYSWVRVRLPDGRIGYVASRDVALFPFKESSSSSPSPSLPLQSPSSWIAFGRRFLGAPYTWGGTTPLGFDCSGFVSRIFSENGVVLRRNSYEQAFQDPQLAPVALDALKPGDLLFFGSPERIDHEAMWIGDGTVLQATRHGVPGVQVTPFDSEFLKPRFRYARRLKISSKGEEKLGSPLDTKKVAALRSTLDEISRGSGAHFGIYFKDLSTGLSLSQNPSAVFHAASTMKTPVLLELLRRVDAGTVSLSDTLLVKNEFKSLVDGSPFAIGLEDNDGPTVAHLGERVPIDFLAREMIVRSSNLATNILLTHLGPANVQAFTDALGAPTVKVKRCVEDTKAYEKGMNNETDAAGMGTVMEAVVRTPKLSPAAKAKAWEILIGQTFNEEIPAGIPSQSGVVVAHKTGNMSTSQHDCAIVRLPDGREYVLVLLANDFGANEEGRARAITAARKMSRAVWEAMIAP
jgi:beta-lactamase class A